MIDELFWHLFPSGGDYVSCLTEFTLLLGAVTTLGLAVLTATLNALTPRPAR